MENPSGLNAANEVKDMNYPGSNLLTQYWIVRRLWPKSFATSPQLTPEQIRIVGDLAQTF